jgi:hypothetical protein
MLCNEARELIDGGGERNTELGVHLEICRECRAYYWISERLNKGNIVHDTPDLSGAFRAKQAAAPKRVRISRWRFASLMGSLAALLIVAGIVFNPFAAEHNTTAAEELTYDENYDALESYYMLAVYDMDSNTNYNAIDYYYSLAVY